MHVTCTQADRGVDTYGEARVTSPPALLQNASTQPVVCHNRFGNNSCKILYLPEVSTPTPHPISLGMTALHVHACCLLACNVAWSSTIDQHTATWHRRRRVHARCVHSYSQAKYIQSLTCSAQMGSISDTSTRAPAAFIALAQPLPTSP